jgi:hypothetical protein
VTGDDTERRKQFLKQQLSMLRGARRLAEKLHPSAAEAVDQRWKEQQLRWEVEDELDREEEEAAVKRRQQEAEAQPESAKVDPPSSELSDATDDEIRAVLRPIYRPFLPGTEREGQGPNLADIYPLAVADLEKLGLAATSQRIQDIADEEEFKGTRGRPGKRRT